MKHEDKAEFAGLMQLLAEYYGREISDALIGMYWQGLERYDIQSVRESLNRHMCNPETGQFFPKIADVSKMIGGTSNDKALQAWAKVDRAVRRVGPYQSVAFDDALIHRVLHEMGGWIAMGTKTDDEWPFVAREFENRYRGFAARGTIPEYPRKLIGIAEAHNAIDGRKIDAPILIGDIARATEVIEGGSSKEMIGIHRMDIQARSITAIEKH